MRTISNQGNQNIQIKWLNATAAQKSTNNANRKMLQYIRVHICDKKQKYSRIKKQEPTWNKTRSAKPIEKNV